MNDTEDSSGNLAISLGKVLCFASAIGYGIIFVFSNLFHWGYSLSIFLLFIVAAFFCIGGVLYIFGNRIKDRQVFDRLWEKTSGDFF